MTMVSVNGSGTGSGHSSRLAAYRESMRRSNHRTIGGAEGLDSARAPAVDDGVADTGSRLTSPGATARSKPAANAPAPKVGIYSQAQADALKAAAHFLAVAQDRQRAAAVFASPASKGRERVCARLLGHSQGWSAAEIIAQLPHLPTDAELPHLLPDPSASGSSAKTDTSLVWDKAYGIAGSESVHPSQPTQAKADAVWDRAYGRATQ